MNGGCSEWYGTKEVYVKFKHIGWIKSPHIRQYLVGNFISNWEFGDYLDWGLSAVNKIS